MYIQSKFLFFIGLICGISLLNSPLQAQVKQAQKRIKQKKYEQALDLLVLALENKSEEIQALHELSLLYQVAEFEQKNLAQAYIYSSRCIALVKTLKDKERIALQKKGMGLQHLEQERNKLNAQAYSIVMKTPSLGSLDTFINVFDIRNNIQNKEAHHLRHQLAFVNTQAQGTWAAYERFHSLYGEYTPKFSPYIDTTLQIEMFEAYIRQHGWYAFGNFAVKYPQNLYVQDSTAAIKFIVISSSKEIDEYERFLQNYRQSRFTKIALDSIVSLTLAQESNLGMYDFVLRNYPSHARIDEVWAKYRLLFLRQKSEEEFIKTYPQAPK